MNKIYISSFFSGFLFAIGLGISGMMDSQKVQGFMDITGRWDPSLAMVMIGGIPVTFLCYSFIFKRKVPVYEKNFALPTNNKIDKNLILGAIVFGIGWGLGGLCPGPAISNLGSLNPAIFLFVFSMFIGYYIHEKFSRRPPSSDVGGMRLPTKNIFPI
jgi:uncharacterized membrane protein YedE/YeeE